MANQKIDASQVAFSPGGAGSLTVQEVDGVPTVAGVDTIVVSNGTLTDDGGGQVTITTGGGSNLTVEETDGVPTVANVNTIKVTNGTLTDDGGGVVTLTTGGSTSPASPDKSVQYNNAGSFGAVTVNATGTTEYLKQVSSGTPAFAQVAYSEISGTPTIPSAAGTVTAETSYGNASNAGAAATFSKGDHTHGTPSLSTNTPAAVAGTGSAGSGTTPSKDDHIHALGSSFKDAGVSLVVDGGGAAITNTTKFFFAWAWSGTLTAWDLIADQSGSITFDVKDAAYASFPGSAASIFSTVPALSSAQSNQASSLSIAITKGHWAEVVITGAATCTYCTLALYITRS